MNGLANATFCALSGGPLHGVRLEVPGQPQSIVTDGRPTGFRLLFGVCPPGWYRYARTGRTHGLRTVFRCERERIILREPRGPGPWATVTSLEVTGQPQHVWHEVSPPGWPARVLCRFDRTHTLTDNGEWIFRKSEPPVTREESAVA